MSTYSFKKEVLVYLVSDGLKYLIDVSEVDFGQEIRLSEFSDKTLHSPTNYFNNVVLDMASPAGFNIIVPALREPDLYVVFDKALDVETFDLYVQTPQDTFKIEYCVITNLDFIIEKTRVLGFGVSGEARKVEKVSPTIPGVFQTRDVTRTYNRVNYVNAVLGGTTINNITSVAVGLQNKIKWTPYKTVTACSTDEPVLYPTDFTIEGKILSGTINSYELVGRQYSTGATLLLEAGHIIGSTVYGFIFNIDTVAFTNRETPSQIFQQNYDWRMTQNPTSLHEVITYNVLYTGVPSGAILDYLGQPILDYLNDPILEAA